MAWVRLDDSAMGNLKIVRLSDSAFRLWVKGLCYCQMHLTDGLIPREALGPMEAKKKDVDALCAVQVTGQAPLWSRWGVDGYAVHDYLNYNDSRAEVQARKVADRRRKQRPADVGLPPDSARIPSGIPLESAAIPSGFPPTLTAGIPFCSVVSESSSGKKGRSSTVVDGTVADRAGRLLEAYRAWFTELRAGARLLLTASPLDWAKACDLCALWDDAHLEKLARIFLTTDDEWISHTGREFSVFALKASWCDGRLRAWEKAQQGVRA